MHKNKLSQNEKHGDGAPLVTAIGTAGDSLV